jgi:hypothetical protein
MPSADRPFQCPQCRRGFRSYGRLKQHLEEHRKPRKCANCGPSAWRQRISPLLILIYVCSDERMQGSTRKKQTDSTFDGETGGNGLMSNVCQGG